MGYTHYFTFKKIDKISVLEKKYQQAVKDCATVIKKYNRDIKKLCSKHPDRLQGYTVHTKIGQYGGINFNGVGSEGCETFVLREHFTQNDGFNFCKTRQGAYDIVVVACLAILKYRLGDAIEVDSDGDYQDWVDGVEFAAKTLKRKIKSPIKGLDRNSLTLCG